MEVAIVIVLEASSGAQGGAGIYAKLPKLELRKCFGKAHHFQEFWDSFRVSVENKKTLSPAIKLEYLKTQSEGPAHQAIAGLELSDANYQIAVEILKDRFGQRQIIERLRNENEGQTKTQMTQSFNQYSENETKIWHQNILNQFNRASSSCLRSHFVISLLLNSHTDVLFENKCCQEWRRN